MSVRITTLGQVRVSVADRERRSLPQQRLRCALLIYLAVERACSRESLLGVFWPDRPHARARRILSQSLYELRYTLGDDAIRNDGDRVVIGPDVTVDIREFEHNVENGAIDAALKAYHGPFLDGFALPNNNAFDMWTERQRTVIERLHRRARRERINALEAAEDHEAALTAARVWADLHPLEDEAQHKLFELLLASGERIEARTRFDQFSRLLREELDVAPLDETVALFDAQTPSEPMVAVTAGETAEPSHDASGGAPFNGVSAAADADPAPSEQSESGAVGRFAPGEATNETPADHMARPPWRSPVRRMPWRRGFLALLGVGVAVFATARLSDGTPRPQSLALPIDSAGYDPSRIAVLYFEDLSEAGNIGHIASGLTESLISELNRVEALSVVSRDGVKPFADSVVPPQQIAAALRTGSIVAGSLQRSGDQLRLTVQLVEGATGNLLESATFQRAMGELFELQDDLTHRVARILRNRIGREVSVQRLTRAGKPEVWELVRRAIDQAEDIWLAEIPIPPEHRRAARLDLDAADEYVRRAERIDTSWPEPTRLRGWIALGRAKVAGPYDTAAYNAEIRAGLAIVNGLIEHDAAGAREYELRGTLRLHLARVNQQNPWCIAVRDSAEQDLRIAVSRDPTLAAASNWLSRLLQYAGNPSEARYYANHALEQDAYLLGGPDIQYRLFATSLDLDDISAASRHCLAGRVDYPRDWRFLQCQLLISVYGASRLQPDSAQVLLRAWTRLDPPRPDGPPQYAHVFRRILYAAILARAGRHESARDTLGRIRHDVKRDPERLGRPFGLDEASVLLMLGDTAEALRAVRDYMAQNPMYRAYVQHSVQLKALHGDPRFLTIVGDTTGF